MSSTKWHVAVVAALGALSFPAFASGEGPATKQDCSVCGDPTWPEIRNPMPAIVVASDAGARTTALQNDPTWPEIRNPLPAIVFPADTGGEPAAVLSDPTWPTMSSVAPALVVNPPSKDRVVRR
jgi:hypothetical protein